MEIGKSGFCLTDYNQFWKQKENWFLSMISQQIYFMKYYKNYIRNIVIVQISQQIVFHNFILVLNNKWGLHKNYYLIVIDTKNYFIKYYKNHIRNKVISWLYIS